MKVLLDTSVVVAGLLTAHPRHESCRPWLEGGAKRKDDVILAATSLGELLAVLTAMPTRPRISPPLAWRMIERLIESPRVNVVALTAAAHATAVRSAASAGLSGGIVHDVVIAHVALHARADRLLTLNPRDFRRAWPEGAATIAEP